MSEWITVNLPWADYTRKVEYPTTPDLTEEMRSKFGTTLADLEPVLDGPLRARWMEAYDAALHDDRHNTDSAAEDSAMAAFSAEGEQEAEYARLRALRSMMYRWLHGHPRMAAYREACDAARRRGSFQEFLRPGVQIELEDGSRYLIGDVNENRGTCDDCVAFDHTAIVARYRVLVTPETLKS